MAPGHGFLHHKVLDHALNHEDFAEFVAEVVSKASMLPGPCILIWDNLKAHSRKVLEELCTPHNVPYRFVPPYSPMLNAIELAFSAAQGTLNDAGGALPHQRPLVA